MRSRNSRRYRQWCSGSQAPRSASAQATSSSVRPRGSAAVLLTMAAPSARAGPAPPPAARLARPRGGTTARRPLSSFRPRAMTSQPARAARPRLRCGARGGPAPTALTAAAPRGRDCEGSSEGRGCEGSSEGRGSCFVRPLGSALALFFSFSFVCFVVLGFLIKRMGGFTQVPASRSLCFCRALCPQPSALELIRVAFLPHFPAFHGKRGVTGTSGVFASFRRWWRGKLLQHFGETLKRRGVLSVGAAGCREFTQRPVQCCTPSLHWKSLAQHLFKIIGESRVEKQRVPCSSTLSFSPLRWCL